MASLKFEGEIEELNSIQDQFIRDVLEKRGFKDNKVVFEAVGKVGDNYVASVKRITVINENGDNFHMIAKIAPKLEVQRVVISAGLSFNNESVMYTEVFPKYEHIQQAANVAPEDKLLYPECYGCIQEEPNELILLEDLKLGGYEMLDRLKPLTNDAVKIVLKSFATLHSLSFALKNFEPDSYDTLRNKLLDMWKSLSDKSENDLFLSGIEANVLGVFQGDDKYKKYIIGSLAKTPENSDTIYIEDADSKYSVIQQGDGWTNNLLFKLENDVPKECIMIDYQISRETNPVGDILYMIFNCTDYKARAEHFFEWINYYHEELDRLLHYYGLKADSIYPRVQLDADIKRYSKMYFGISLLVLSVTLRKVDEASVMKEAMNENDIAKMSESMGVSTLGEDTLSQFKTRVTELIDSCVELQLF